jgi:competence protein ComGC
VLEVAIILSVVAVLVVITMLNVTKNVKKCNDTPQANYPTKLVGRK